MTYLSYASKLSLSLCVGLVGGWMFYAASLPLPWMLGAMFAVTTAAVSGLPVVSPKRIRPPLAAIIGVTIGSAFHPSMSQQLAACLPVTIALVLSTVCSGAVGFVYLKQVAKFDHVTAFFAGMPAGVYEMTVQGGAAGGDERRIALLQGIRIFLIVLFVPIAFNLTLHYGSTSGLSIRPGTTSYSVTDVGVLISCGLIGWGVAQAVKLPNAAMLGPLLCSAAAHLLELTSTAPPYVMISAAQVVLGASIGGQFIGADRKLFVDSVCHGIVLLPLMLLVCATLAAIAHWASGLGFAVVLLALAPGGTTEMSLVALALNAEVGIVVGHQLLRVIMIHMFASQAFRMLEP